MVTTPQQQSGQQQQGQGISMAGPAALGYGLYRAYPYLGSAASTPSYLGGLTSNTTMYSPAGEAIGSQMPTMYSAGGEAIGSAAAPTISSGGQTIASGGVAPPTQASSGLGTLGTAAAIAAALHGGYGLTKAYGQGNAKAGLMPGLETGAGVGALVGGPAGALIGAPIGAGVGALTGMAKAGKHEDQIKRDQVREAMRSAGAIDETYGLTLADGTKFNIGLDGGARGHYDFSGGRRPYEVKAEHPFSAQAVGWADPLAEVLTGGDPKLRSDFAGYFANAAMSNSQGIEGVRSNVLQIMEDLKLNEASVRQGLDALKSAGKIDDSRYAAYMNSLGSLFGGNPETYTLGSINELGAMAAPVVAPPVAAVTPPPTPILQPNLPAITNPAPVARAPSDTVQRLRQGNSSAMGGS